MMTASYSVAIRTIGTAGEKYIQLIKSIGAQTVKPDKIIVVLPEGCAVPERIDGNEEFVFSLKGMVSQRLTAVNYTDSKYILFCDDDVELSPDFAELLLNTLELGNYQCASGPLLSFFPPKKAKYIIASLLGGACIMLHGRKDTYTRLLATTGWSYNHTIDTKVHKTYNADSLAWTCFCINRETMLSIKFEDELWLQRNGYAAFDDQSFFTKLKLYGYKTCVVSDAAYIHNDAKTSTQGKTDEIVYNYSFNQAVYWYRFMYSVSNSVWRKRWVTVCFAYKLAMSYLYKVYMIIAGRAEKTIIRIERDGRRDAIAFVKSDEYQQIPSVFSHRGDKDGHCVHTNL